MRQATRRRSWRVATGLATVLALALGTGACSGGDDDDKPSGGSPTSTGSTATEVPTTVTIAKLTGRLPAPKREALTAAVQKVIDGWWDAAYLGGDYPRTDFGDAWPGFTAGARAQARQDAALTSNQAVGSAIDGVEPERKDVKLDVVALHQRAIGVTARVSLRFATTGDQPATVGVTGRVYLTPTKSGWQVFGYDLTKGSR